MTILVNLLLGFVPTLILSVSIAAGIEDAAGHRRGSRLDSVWNQVAMGRGAAREAGR